MVNLSSITAVLTAGLLPQLYALPYPTPIQHNILTTHSTNAAGLHSAAVAKGLDYLGTATDNPELTDSAYMKQLNNTDDFGQLTPGNSLKVWLSFICDFDYSRLM